MHNTQIIIELHGVIFSVVAGIFLILKNHGDKEARRALIQLLGLNILMLLSDIHEIAFHGNTTELGRFMIPFSNFMLFLFQILITAFMGRYIDSLIRSRDMNSSRKWLKQVYILSVINILLLLFNQFTGWYYYIDSDNRYQRGRFFLLCISLAVLGIFIEMNQVIKYRDRLKDMFWIVMSYFFFPLGGLVIQIINPGISFMNIGITISVLLLIIFNEYREEKIQREQERVLAQSRAYLLNSQIKPHFLFNSLSVIQSLIEDDPETAVDAVGHFSKYLRKNLNLSVTESAISVWEELDFTQNYLYMEKLRFGDKINIIYDIDESLNFEMPFLSIQPLAENAIRHGIRKKLEGGNLWIHIFEQNGWNIVQLVDDGVGFDPDHLQNIEWDSQSNGVGVKNVEERIELMCHGKMQVESVPGHGTRVTISIPKGRN